MYPSPPPSTEPVAARSKVRPGTIALVVAGVLTVVLLLGGAAVTLTLRSGFLDEIMDGVQDANALNALHKGACLDELPLNETGGTSGGNLRPPKVVDCDSEEASWIIAEAVEDIPMHVLRIHDERHCRPHLQRLASTYVVVAADGKTRSVYCIVSKPMGWSPPG